MSFFDQVVATSYRILVIDDDHALLDTLDVALRREGHVVTSVEFGKAGLRMAMEGGHDLIIVDIGLPDLSGMDVVSRLRDAGSATPVIFLTARSGEEDVVRALGVGGDLYLSKPFSVPELLARVQALMRRLAQRRRHSLSRGGLVVDTISRTATRNGYSIHLTEREFQVLVTLMEAEGRPVSRKDLLRKVWGLRFDTGTVTLDVHLSHLRKKLQTNGPQLIRTIPGEGWSLEGS